MAASVFDSALFARLFPTGEMGRLFTDTAEIRAMLLVEGTLAKVQGEAGIIPTDSAAFIHRASLEHQIDPGGLALAIGQNGVAIPALLAAFRKVMEAPDHAQYVHWGATSQDITDTALMLRLRQALSLVETDLRAVLARLATLAEQHADTPMPARTWGQHATPTSFGAVVAGWGAPILDLLDGLRALRDQALLVSLSGAAGTSSQLGPDPAALRAALGQALGLGDPGRSWHVDRRPVLLIADWLAQVTLCLGRMGADVTAHSRTELAEVHLRAAGASSTMPQKQNPVPAEALVALARMATGLMGVMQGASLTTHQRDGAAWLSEWMALPQIVLGAGSAAQTARGLVDGLAPNTPQMVGALEMTDGLIHAEALSFALAALMPRPEAQAKVKALCAEARDMRQNLADLAQRDFPELDIATLFDPAQQMGQAPQAARQFAIAARDALS